MSGEIVNPNAGNLISLGARAGVDSAGVARIIARLQDEAKPTEPFTDEERMRCEAAKVSTGCYAQATAAANLQALIAATPIGGTLYLSQVIEAVNTPAGVRNSTGILINGAAADLALTASQVAAALTNSLTWTGV